MARLYLVMIALCFIALYPTMGKKLYLVQTKDKAGDYIRIYNKDDNTDYMVAGRKDKANDYNNEEKVDYIIGGGSKAKSNDYNEDEKTDYIIGGRKDKANDYNNEEKVDYIIS